MAPTHDDSYRWHEASPGVWQRDADEAEIFYSSLIKLYEGSGRMHFAITGHISLTIDVPENASPQTTADLVDKSLRAAWLCLRHELPTIASQVKWDVGAQKWIKIYQTVPDKAAQEAWLEATFKPISTGQTGVEWANSDPPAPSVATLCVIIPPQSSPSVVRRDLVLRSPHDVIDGIGTLLLFNQFTALFASTLPHPSATFSSFLNGEETSRLSPPYRVAAKVPSILTPGQTAKLAALRADKAQTSSDPSVCDLTLPFTRGALLPSRHQRVSRNLSQSQTAALLAALKPLGATPTHAFHAAIALTMRDIYLSHHPSSREETAITHLRYNSYLLRNERPACQPPFNTPAHCASVYHSVSGGKLTVTMPATASSHSSGAAAAAEFLDALAQIKAHYHSVRDDADHYALAPHIWADATPSLPASALALDNDDDDDDTARAVPVPEPSETPSVSISSMGVIDDRLIKPDWEGGGGGWRVRVDEPWVTGEELGNGLGVFLGTFRGRLEGQR
ncbi:hypothetical protein NEMBOFW57_005708 [Staphylotrichum longicolle]|uniref:Uncharacterized protein n=1 Tax=Staphylotrichum longicolle TaxID=669026 RepID=A0AAD4EXR1_9PEZI|nr:hypothetical protein NEMBOFW57_005708 [Staphylotrichum longicolle]